MSGMTAKQAKWLAEHPGYVRISSWGGPYNGSGILYANGTFSDDPEAMPAYGCLVVGERPCGECHLQSDELCDICGRRQEAYAVSSPERP
jgi:hypothetical protein